MIKLMIGGKMASVIGSILRAANKSKNEPYNILSWVVHERFQSNLEGTNARYYLLQNGPGTKGAWKKQYADIPNNTVILDNYKDSPLEVIPPYLNLDLIVSHHKFGIIQTALQLGNFLKLPVIHNEHTMPTSPQLQQAVPELKKLNGDINVFITHTSRSQWGYSEIDAEVIEHGIDSTFFKKTGKQRKNQVLTVGNDMLNRAEILGFDIFKRVVIDSKIPFQIVGDTAGLSSPAQNVYELKSIYDESAIYFNPSRLSPLPMSLLEACAMECAIVSTDNNLISEVIRDGYNGYLSNDENVLRNHIQRLLNNPEERDELGKNARKTIQERFNLERFTADWDKLFSRAAGIRK
jgi:glycosyltransferase involved in cell wall biosynthesis